MAARLENQTIWRFLTGRQDMPVNRVIQSQRQIKRKYGIADMLGMIEGSIEHRLRRIFRLKIPGAIDIDCFGVGDSGQADTPYPRRRAQALCVGHVQHLVMMIGIIGQANGTFKHGAWPVAVRRQSVRCYVHTNECSCPPLVVGARLYANLPAFAKAKLS